MSTSNIVPIEAISQKIFIVRGVKVMLDYDLAEFYQVPTMRMNEQVKRNHGRFPIDFMFQLTKNEYENLISQIAISSSGQASNLRYQIGTSRLGIDEPSNRSQIATGSEDNSNRFQIGTGSGADSDLKSQIVTSRFGKLSNLKLQSATSSWGGRRQLPYAFTEHGVAMLSSVLHSSRAVQINIFIIRAFIKLRELLASNKELANKVEWIEKEQRLQNKHINAIYRTLDGFLKEPIKPKEVIKPKAPLGFRKN